MRGRPIRLADVLDLNPLNIPNLVDPGYDSTWQVNRQGPRSGLKECQVQGPQRMGDLGPRLWPRAMGQGRSVFEATELWR